MRHRALALLSLLAKAAAVAIELPVVDLGAQDAAQTIAHACREFGFFLLKNPLSPELVEDCFRQSRAFFEQSPELKLAVLADKANRGYTPMREETLDPENQSTGDTKEGYYIFRELSEEESSSLKFPLSTPNQWPNESHFPGWKDTMLKYYDAMMEVGHKTAALLAEGVGLGSEFFAPHLTHSMSALRLLHYAADASDPGQGVFGCGAHSDYGLLTFLATDDNAGLQVLLNGAWHDVTPRPGYLVVNLGDMLSRWTNGELVSTTHRVVSRGGAERYSMPFFFEPNFDCVVEAKPPFVGPGKPAKFPPITSGEHLLEKYRQTHANFESEKPEISAENLAEKAEGDRSADGSCKGGRSGAAAAVA